MQNQLNIVFIGLLALVFGSGQSMGAATWTKKANMPTARMGASTSVVDGQVYVISALKGSGNLKKVEAYDPATDTWTKKDDMPTARELHSISVVNGKLYAVGGQSQSTFAGFSIVEAYDPLTERWLRKADMPAPRIFSTTVVDGKIYGFGGRATRGGAPLSSVFEYDPAMGTWAVKEDMPGNNGGMGASTVGRRVYLIGGSSANYPFNSRLATVWEYLPSPDFDFDGDGVVDARDMSLMVDHWHMDTPRYDLAPAPAGDGLVDVQDLVALSERLFEDYRIIAHWRLDESEGDVAYDSVAENDGLVLGDPVWQPAGGQVDGALQLDGVDDHINALVKLNPAEEVFSVFAWIQGAIPGQVIISQEGGADWLRTDAQGYFMTALMGTSGRTSGPLISETTITDDSWHRVGLAYDGLNRVLSVDDTVVAQDTQPSLAKASGSLQIGTGRNQAADSFWAGLIDDIQLYDRAIEP